jgi:hypothetical protein
MAVGNVEAAMRIDEDLDIGPVVSRIRAVSSAAFALVLAGHAAIEIAVPPVRGPRRRPAALVRVRIELQRGVTGLDDVPDFADHALLAGELGLVGMGVERELIAHRPRRAARRSAGRGLCRRMSQSAMSMALTHSTAAPRLPI